jgi:toxin-antitoxin system PIN domain toxin
MKRCLVDVNVALALSVPSHQFHEVCLRWFDQLAAGEAGLCRIVQLALVRLLGNRSVMGTYAVSAQRGWQLTTELLQDERVEFVAEPVSLDAVLPDYLRYPVPAGRLVTDAYLAAFAIASSRQIVTLDSGFRQFERLDVRLLAVSG